MVVVDTSVLIDYLIGRDLPHTQWLTEELGLQRIGITTLVQMEVLQGIREDKRLDSTLKSMDIFEVFDTGSVPLAIAAARNFRVLQKAGITVRSSIDCLIATFCIEERHALLHNDRDYDGFEQRLGLQVVRPLAFPLH